jgi:SAM-dependent methyltransferase
MSTAQEQMKLWNGPSGHAWAEGQEMLDGLFKPVEEKLAEALVADTARTVLDVGCGTGSTTLAAARRIAPAGHCVGIDISEPMLEVARARAGREGARVTFIHADAQTHVFEPVSFDRIISRFGVMFFGDPVRAFANLRHAARDGAQLDVITWRSPAENTFMTTAERAAAPLLPQMPPREVNAPGQFAFADAHRVRGILAQAGWASIDLQPLDVVCVMPEQALRFHVTRLGPVGVMLQNVDEPTRARVTEALLAAFRPFVQGAQARFTAACWRLSARAAPV